MSSLDQFFQPIELVICYSGWGDCLKLPECVDVYINRAANLGLVQRESESYVLISSFWPMLWCLPAKPTDGLGSAGHWAVLPR